METVGKGVLHRGAAGVIREGTDQSARLDDWCTAEHTCDKEILDQAKGQGRHVQSQQSLDHNVPVMKSDVRHRERERKREKVQVREGFLGSSKPKLRKD